MGGGVAVTDTLGDASECETRCIKVENELGTWPTRAAGSQSRHTHMGLSIAPNLIYTGERGEGRHTKTDGEGMGLVTLTYKVDADMDGGGGLRCVCRHRRHRRLTWCGLLALHSVGVVESELYDYY